MQKKIIQLLVVILITLNSCSSDDKEISSGIIPNTQQDQIECKNGILHFKDSDVFYNTLNKLTADGADIQSFEQEYGFKSMATYIDEIYDTIDLIEDEASYKNVLQQYKDYIKITDDGDIVPAIDGYGYTTVANSEGQYYIENVLYTVKPDYLSVSEYNASTRSTDELKLQYSLDIEIPSETRAEKGDQYVERSYISGSKRINVYVKSIFYYSHTVNNGINEYKGRYTIQFHGKGMRFSNPLIGSSSWAKHKTHVYFDGLVFDFKIPGYTSTFYNLKSRYYENGDNHDFVSSKKCHNYYINFNDTYEYKYSNYLQQPEVITLRFRARSGGTGNCGVVVNTGNTANWEFLNSCK